MNCMLAKEKMTIAVYGTLSEEEQTALNEHLSRCQDCSRRWEKAAPLRNRASNAPDIPLPDPDRSWGIIADRLTKHRRTSTRRWLWRWAPAAAVLLLVFAAGLLFGRRVFIVPAGWQSPLPWNLSETALETYADSLQPLLVNFINPDGVRNPVSMKRLERRIISDLLDHTRILKTQIPDGGNPALRELLEDLEFILTAMDNMEPGDRDTAQHLAGVIRDNDVTLRLRQLIVDRTTL
jgi:hypothetical protein